MHVIFLFQVHFEKACFHFYICISLKVQKCNTGAILCLWFCASLLYINNCPTRCNTKQSIYYSASSLYMFRASTTPIIRSTQNCNYSLWYWSHFLCSYLPPTWPSCVASCWRIMNPLTPNDNYSGSAAPLNSKHCILYIYSTHIGTEYFKHGIYSPFFPLQNAVCFIILTHLVPVLFTFCIEGVLKLKK